MEDLGSAEDFFIRSNGIEKVLAGETSLDEVLRVPASRGDQGQREPALLAGAGVLASESEGMRFVRGGVVNPLMRLPRSNLLTVGYRIHDGYLERLAWPLTDAAGSVKPTMQKLIPADSLRLQFYDGTRWQESWSSVQAIPVAVRMTLHSPQWGEIERIWLLRGPQ
ncbi:type II secretion system protein GspJ [Escherichia coli]|nr:type II secretion system protein GspJ [Escherichia coli]